MFTYRSEAFLRFSPKKFLGGGCLAASCAVASIGSLRPRLRAAFPFLFAAFLSLAASGRAQAPIPVYGVLPGTTLTLPGLLDPTNSTYQLEEDVDWSSTDTNISTPIEIVGSGVTLDLNGKTIRATGSATNEGNLIGIRIGNGLLSHSVSNVTVTNGTIRGFRRNGISVVSGTQIWLGDLTNADIHNPTTNAPNFVAALLNPTAGISIEAASGVTVSNVVISNVSGGPNVMSVAGLEALFAPGLQVIGTTVTGVSNSVAVGNAKNLCNALSVLYSPDVTFSNITVANVVGNSNTATANGLVTYSSANFQLLGSSTASNTISGITNYGGVAAGISGTQVSGMTVRHTRISNLFAGQDWTNNLIGHTVLGMVFGPLKGFPLGIANITVTNGGSGYTSAPTVTVSPVANDKGAGAQAVATVSNGSVVSVQVTAPGTNFQTFPSIAFSGGGGSNAAAIVLPFFPTPSFAPVNVLYDPDNTNTGGGVIVTDCVVDGVTGSIDDAHGISFFGVTNVTASNVVVRNVLDGTNTLGLGGSKATGIEVFGNPMVPDSRIKLIDCRVENIRAISPGDLAANGFSAAGGGITFINCTASNVSVANTLPGRQSAYGYGFGWAPDIRLNYQYPAWNVVHSNSTAIDCDYGFDTFNHRNASYFNSTNINNRITNFLVQPSTPGQVGGTERIFFGAVWNQVYAATNGPIPVPVWNTAQNNNTNGSAPAVPLNSFLASDTTYTVRVPGSYNLTNSVLWGSINPFATVPLVLAGNNISLNLQGHTLGAWESALLPANATGLKLTAPAAGVTVSNGTIDGFRDYGVRVDLVQGAVFSDLTIRNIGTNSAGQADTPLPAGFFATLSSDITLSNVTVSNVSAAFYTNGIIAGVAAELCSNFTFLNTDTNSARITDIRGTFAPNPDVANVNSATNASDVFAFYSILSTGTACANLTVGSIHGDEPYKCVTGIVIAGGSNATISGGWVRGVTNEGGTVQGILGAMGVQHMTVTNVQVSHIRSGQKWTNNALAHTALGMAFAPSARPMRATIREVTVTNGGTGYTSPPNVALVTLDGDPGSGATALATVSGGKVTGVTVLNQGTNYIQAPAVQFTGGGGSGAGALILPWGANYYSANGVGNIRVVDCVISNVIGGIDDAHGISLFVVTNTTVDRVRVHHVRDGDNTLGVAGSKATGIESYGDPTSTNCQILLTNCHVENIVADSPGDLAALGFSAAGAGIRFVGCTASNVAVIGTNALTPGASPGRGVGFAWAPDIRIVYQYPARNVTLEQCVAVECEVGFDTFNFVDSDWIGTSSQFPGNANFIPFLVEPSTAPDQVGGTKRVLYGAVWNELTDANNYPRGLKPVPVWNVASGNQRYLSNGTVYSGFGAWAESAGGLPTPGTAAYSNALRQYAFGGSASYSASGSQTRFGSVGFGQENGGTNTYLMLTEVVRTDDPNLSVWGESQTDLTQASWNSADVNSQMSQDQTQAGPGTRVMDFYTPQGSGPRKFLKLKATYQTP